MIFYTWVSGMLRVWVEGWAVFSFTLIRQLSEENANLQVYVEKESNEKKRLSRNNEELMWRLQTGELSPRMSPTQSPLHRPASSPASPSRMQTFPRWVKWVSTSCTLFYTSFNLCHCLQLSLSSHHSHRIIQNMLHIPENVVTICSCSSHHWVTYLNWMWGFIVQFYFICWTMLFIYLFLLNRDGGHIIITLELGVLCTNLPFKTFLEA